MNNPKLPGVYLIRCAVNGKVYVGSAASSIENRWRQHRHDLRQGKHKNLPLQNAWRKYGEQAFEWSVLENCPNELAENREQWYVDTYINAGMALYNIRTKVVGSNLGHKFGKRDKPMSAETRAKISTAQKGRKHTPEQIAKHNDAIRGREHTPEHRAKVSKPFTVVSPNGDVISGANLAQFCREHGLNNGNMSAVLRGKKYSHKGYTAPNGIDKCETKRSQMSRAKSSTSQRGRKKSPEQIVKIRAAAHSKPFTVISPEGEIIHGTNLRRFSLDHGLDPANMYSVVHGKAHSCKGYTAPQSVINQADAVISGMGA